MRNTLVLSFLSVLLLTAQQPQPPAFELDEATVAQLQDAMASGRHTSRTLVELYIDRIEKVDRSGPTLRSVIELNPEALAIADALDAERKAKGARGPLHGIPVLIKDNIETGDRMMTTAGSLALDGSIAARDSFVADRLRAAGAVILGKTNLSEWANFRAANVGTETSGSILSPSNQTMLVGIKPTVGLVSRSGIIPIAHTQDTAGPMARTVSDAAVLLGALTGVDPRDKATAASVGKALADYTKALRADALKGARIGVARKRYFGYHPDTDRLIEQAIADMKAQGAVIVDPADIPTAAQLDGCEFDILLYEFKADLNAYLGALGPAAKVHSLKDLIAFDEREKDREMPYFGQEILLQAEKKGPLTSPAYRKAASKAPWAPPNPMAA